jgi:HEAT repeat protein
MSSEPVPRQFRRMRLRTLLMGIAICGVLFGLGMHLYRAWSPVRRWTREARPGNPQFTRIQAVLNLTYDVPASEREEAFAVLLQAVKDPDPMVRAQAATALAGRRDHYGEVVSILRGLMKDPAPRVREVTIFRLESFVKPDAPDVATLLPDLVAALDDPSPAVRLEACRAFYVYGRLPQAVHAMARLVREEKGTYRQGALGFLLQGGPIPKDLEPRLRELMRSENLWERISARQTMIRLGISAQEREAIIQTMLDSPDPAERLAVAHSLIQLCKPTTAIAALKYAAVKGDQGTSERAVQLLLHLMSRPGGSERLEAAEALIQIGKPESTTSTLKELADREDMETSARAARLLDIAKDPGESP